MHVLRACGHIFHYTVYNIMIINKVFCIDFYFSLQIYPKQLMNNHTQFGPHLEHLQEGKYTYQKYF